MPRYYRPTTRADALAALAEAGERARPLVGGTDLLVGLRHHTVEPDLLVDLKGVTDLPEPIVVGDDGVQVGATYTLGELVAHPVFQDRYPALVEAALTVGSVAIRNRASLVANSCNASPAADTAPPLLVHGARVTIASLDGDRTAALDEFFLGPPRTLCGPGELVTRIELPRPAPGSGSAFRRLTRRRGVDLATGSVGAGGRPGDGQRGRRCRPGRWAGARDGRGRTSAAARRGPRPGRPGRRRRPRRSSRPAAGGSDPDLRRPGQPGVPAGHTPRPQQARGPRCGRPPEPQGDGVMSTSDHLVDDALQTGTLTVNGSERTVAVPAHRTLLDGLREEVGLPGTKSCCAEGECGACTVLLDGKAVNSCLVLCVEAEGHVVTTVEGLSEHGLTDLQEEFLNAGAVQCGFCIPGQVVSAEYLLRTNSSPSEPEIREALSGNLCRCAGYQRIVRAVQATAARRNGQ